jgi:ACS family tartrate transporter-like MFS transporter
MQSIAASASDGAVRIAAWHVIPLVAVGYIVSYIDRANVGFAATMNRDLGLSATQCRRGPEVFEGVTYQILRE